MIKKQTDAHQYNEERFLPFAKKFSVVTYVLLEMAWFLYCREDVYLMIVLGTGCVAFAAIAWQHPEQLINLSVLPEALMMPLIDRLGVVKRFVSKRRKGYEVGIIEGDKLTKEVRRKLGIDKDTFVCERCGVRKSVVNSWGAMVSTKTGVAHVCVECLDAAVTLRRPTLERWMSK